MAEPAAVRLSRLLSMVPWLEQHPGVSIQDAAEHFGVTPAEFERDLWLTICCGLPGHGPDQLIDIQFWDDDGAVHVLDPQTLDRPLRLSASEAMSLLVGLRLLAQVPGEHDRSALASATAKLEAACDVAQGAAVVVPDPADETLVAAISRAIEAGRAVRIVYAGATRDELTDRVVEPGELVHHAGRTYLIGWCREAGAERTFRVDRVRQVDILDVQASAPTPRPAVTAPPGETVRLHVTPASRWLLENWAVDDAEELPDGDWRATVTVADRDWLTRIVLGQAGGVVVMSPADLRRQIQEAAASAHARLVGS
jgi:proteasome accessory factor C